MKNYNFKNIFYTWILFCIGLIYILYYIWVRFIRERLPKPIPYNLNFLGFLIIIIIIIIFIYFIYNIKYPKHPTKNMLELLSILSKLLEPLKILDTTIKNERKLLIIFAYIINKLTLYNCNRNNQLILLVQFIPKFIVLFSFILDVFYFKKIEIFYFVILINLIPLIFTYIVYSVKKTLELTIQYLEKNYMIYLLTTFEDEQKLNFMYSIFNLKYNDDETLNLRFFIAAQADSLVFEHDPYSFDCIETDYAREAFANKYNLVLPSSREFIPNYDNISRELSKEFHCLIPKVILLQAFTDIYIINIKQPHKVNLVLIILSSYLICWLYILTVSLHTLDLSYLLQALQLTWLKVANPFTELPLYNGFVITKTIVITCIFYLYKLNIIKLVSLGLLGLYIKHN